MVGTLDVLQGTLDHLIGRRVQPLLVVFVPSLAGGEYEEYVQRIVQGTEDVQEGRMSFRERRPPQWKGR